MDTTALRAIQGPLKERYRGEPDAALIALVATGVLGEQEVSCSVDVGRQLVEAGLHPATGGDGAMACSGDMLLQALVACAGVTLQSVAINRGLVVSGQVRAEGLLDFRGTLGIDREVPVGFVSIGLHFDLNTGESAADVEALIKTTERYCVVYQTLIAGTPVEVTTSTVDEEWDHHAT